MSKLKQIFGTLIRLRYFLTFLAFLAVPMFLLLSKSQHTEVNLTAPKVSVVHTEDCFELHPDNEIYQEAAVSNPGGHCVIKNFWQRRFCKAGHCAPAPYRNLVQIRGGDVTIDLMNHILHSDGHSSGIVASTQSNKTTFDREQRNFDFSQQTTRITLKNGVIDLRGLGIGVALIDRWKMNFIDTSAPEGPPHYEKTGFILENLRIITDNTGVILEGDGNTIQNCIIESNGRAAIMMAGPNGLIEGNTIILDNRPFSKIRPITFDKFMEGIYNPVDIYRIIQTNRIQKAAIVLHQADNTLIRNNKILVKDESERRMSIYIDNNSKNINIIGNEFANIKKLIILVNGSTAVVENNTSQDF